MMSAPGRAEYERTKGERKAKGGMESNHEQKNQQRTKKSQESLREVLECA